MQSTTSAKVGAMCAILISTLYGRKDKRFTRMLQEKKYSSCKVRVEKLEAFSICVKVGRRWTISGLIEGTCSISRWS